MDDPIGVILAGGRGRRIGGSKASIPLRGRPLISYSLETLGEALSDVVVLAKAETELPELPGVGIWIEPERDHHPLIGIASALALAGGRSVLVCAADLPFITPELVRQLAATGRVAVAAYQGAIQPLLGRYDASVLQRLPRSGPVREAVLGLAPQVVEVEDPKLLFNVNSPAELLQAASMLEQTP